MIYDLKISYFENGSIENIGFGIYLPGLIEFNINFRNWFKGFAVAFSFRNKIQGTVLISFFATFLSILSGSALAFDPSTEGKWQGNGKSQLRLIGAKTEWLGQNQLFAGIEIRLAPKWKTYWRTPGDTGIPPYFDWNGSENLKKAEVMYPVPGRFQDPTGMTIGYKSQVTLPVLLTPEDPLKPIKLKLSAQYAICYDLCVPVSASQSLTIDGDSAQRFAPVLSMALALTPKPVKEAKNGLGVRTVKIEKEKDASSLTLNVLVPASSKEVDLFVEGPDGMYVPTPKLVKKAQTSDTASLYKISLTDVDEPQKFKGLVLTCTLRADDLAVVQPCPVQ